MVELIFSITGYFLRSSNFLKFAADIFFKISVLLFDDMGGDCDIMITF